MDSSGLASFYDLNLSGSDIAFHPCTMNFFWNSWKTFHASFFSAKCVYRSSSPYVILSRIAHNLWRCDKVRRKRLFVFVVVPDVFVGSTQLTWSFLTWERQDALLMFLWPDSLGAWTFTLSRRTVTSLTMFIGFSPRRVSRAAFSLWLGIIYELSSGGERTISPPSAPSVPVTSLGWQHHSSFGIHLQQGKTHQNVKRSARRHTSEQRRKRTRLSVGEGITWEKLRVLDKDWDT